MKYERFDGTRLHGTSSPSVTPLARDYRHTGATPLAANKLAMHGVNSDARIAAALRAIEDLEQTMLWRKVSAFRVIDGNITFRARLLDLRRAIDRYLAGG